VTPGLAILAVLDGERPNLVCCTVGGKVFVHTPHEGVLEGNVGNDVKFLNLNKNIIALNCGSFEEQP